MELTLFIIVGAVAVVAAAMMLISENAVHATLFLILNFACIAFFFLMLHAPFLAMVQITVYAGAIMVLFLFVIMLLGAERLLPEEHPRFPWLTPAAVALALVFLVATGVAIIRGDVDLTEPLRDRPQVRAVNALDGADGVDVYLNDTPLARGLAFNKGSGYSTWDEGRYTVNVFRAGDNPAEAKPLAQQEVDLNAGEVLSLAAIGTANQPGLVVAPQDVSGVDDKEGLRVVAVNAFPGVDAIDVLDVTHARRTLVENVPFGAASPSFELDEGSHEIGISAHGDENLLARLPKQDARRGTATLWVITSQLRSDNSVARRIIAFETAARPSFGGPRNVGQLLFNRYVLPFEMVAVLLLVAMIGAIVLTHDAGETRGRRVERRLANPALVVNESGQPAGEAVSSRAVEGK